MTERSQVLQIAPKMLTPTQLAKLSKRLGANADRLIERRVRGGRKLASKPAAPVQACSKNPFKTRGRPAKRLANPFCGLIGPSTDYGRYPFFALEVVEGIARLDWHDRPLGSGGSSKPLSVRYLMVILETLEEITAEQVAILIGTKLRQAQRYVKALELALPFLMKSRPRRLVFEMNLPQDEFANAAYRLKLREAHSEPLYVLSLPTEEDLAKLRSDLGEDAFSPGQGINAAYLKPETSIDHQHGAKGIPPKAA